SAQNVKGGRCRRRKVGACIVSEQRGESNFALDSMVFLARDSAGPAQSNFSNGDVIFVQGGPADAVFNIERGRIKCSVVSSDGKGCVISIFEEHEVFGEECVIGQASRLVTATALTKCSVTRIETSVMTR